MVAASKLPINTTATDMELADSMFGDGIKIVDASYSGDANSSGIYTDGDAISPDSTPSDTGVILSTGKATDYTNTTAEANQSAGTSTNTAGIDGDADLNAVAGLSTYDAAIFEAKFVPDGDTLTMQIIFSSEEYLEYVNAGFNDAVGVWVNGVQAQLSIGGGEISIDDINDVSNQNLFLDNAGNQYNTEMDGLTVTLTLKAPVNSGEINTIKIGIADAGDASYDSNLLIAGNSIQTVTLVVDDTASVAANSSTEIDVLDNDISEPGVALTVTHINGVAVSAGDSVTLPTGEVITLNADGSLTAVADGDVGSNVFSYSLEDETGNTDTGFVTLETTIPCFVAGTLVQATNGECLIEELKAGDMIETMNGPQPLRWVGSRFTHRTDGHAPVKIAAGTFGSHGAVMLSQQHRILLTGPHAELLFDSVAVLVRAKDLVNDRTVRLDTSNQPVQYFHLLFDSHQVIRANGLWSESFHPGEMVMSSMDTATRTELLDLFPQLDPAKGRGYGADCFPSLKGYEAQVFLNVQE